MENENSFLDFNDEDFEHDIHPVRWLRAKDAWNSITGQRVYDGKPWRIKANYPFKD